MARDPLRRRVGGGERLPCLLSISHYWRAWYAWHMKPESKLTERRVALTMPAGELAALDAYCAEQRRATGENIDRAEIIRRAIRDLIAGAG